MIARATVWSALALTLGASSPAPGPAADPGVERLRWLAGCWEMRSGPMTIEEQWMAPRAGTMLGMSRTVSSAGHVSFEAVLIREDGDRLAFEAHPAGQPAAVFLSTEMSDSHAVFENAAHDFPQRIVYRYRERADSLHARIEGTRGGNATGVDFRYRRAPCGGGFTNARIGPIVIWAVLPAGSRRQPEMDDHGFAG